MKIKKFLTALSALTVAALISISGCSYEPVPYLCDVYSAYFPLGTSCKKSIIESYADI